MESLDHFLQVRSAKLSSFQLIGFQGEKLEDERKVFDQLKQSINEIATMNQYLVILPGIKPLAAVEVIETDDVPQGMMSYTIPEDEYVIFRFEKKFIGEFWINICTRENQAKYQIDLSKPRYEIFTPVLQSTGMVEWYIPTMS
ncbi:hypothetical protein [Paenibacillus sp. GCM10027626]|uniref:hypothetical protein n=1 Tax=Paenibacillus sp. GCM10027626 TaxID=3273411 RepID=UPI003639EF64